MPTLQSSYLLCDADPGIVFYAPGSLVVRAFAKAPNKSRSGTTESVYHVVHPTYDELPMRAPKTAAELRVSPEVTVRWLRKTLSVVPSVSTAHRCDCGPRDIHMRVVIVDNPLGHFDFLPPLSGCEELGDMSSTATGLEARDNSVISPTEWTSSLLEAIVQNATERDREEWRRQFDELSGTTCQVAASAGLFNVSEGQCVGNLVSRAKVLQSGAPKGTHFGVRRDGLFFTGPIDSFDLKNLSSVFESLVTGDVWLVRQGLQYIKHSITDLSEEGLLPRTLLNDTHRSARSAIGYDSSGRLMMLQVDGSDAERERERGRESSIGVSLKEFADIAVEVGFFSAVNLVGGEAVMMSLNQTPVSFPSSACNVSAINNTHAFDVCPEKVSTVSCVHPLSKSMLLGGSSWGKDSSSLPTMRPTPSPSLGPTERKKTVPSYSDGSSPFTSPTSKPTTDPTRDLSDTDIGTDISTQQPSCQPTMLRVQTLQPTDDRVGSNDDISKGWFGNNPGTGTFDDSMDGVMFEGAGNFTVQQHIEALELELTEWRLACFVLAVALMVSLAMNVQKCCCRSPPEVLYVDHQLEVSGDPNSRPVSGQDDGMYEVHVSRHSNAPSQNGSQHSQRNVVQKRAPSPGKGVGPGKYQGEKGWQAKLQHMDLEADTDDDDRVKTVELYGRYQDQGRPSQRERGKDREKLKERERDNSPIDLADSRRGSLRTKKPKDVKAVRKTRPKMNTQGYAEVREDPQPSDDEED
eukprot:CAMPEP_0182424676 /NCGR_PEP_ID=MMETSP1167-20130531/10907_1 /TAXON_ID=2988 /ORGANISM="Mallomonas Sp, Strain CCMP3275" /LENGTH=745 /DNA_ID=CAMNT_0024604663 /DNA_START=94 /DNA_END=2331 /DNA_ORIENTATION=+